MNQEIALKIAELQEALKKHVEHDNIHLTVTLGMANDTRQFYSVDGIEKTRFDFDMQYYKRPVHKAKIVGYKPKLTAEHKQAIAKYSKETCVEAYLLNTEDGEGPRTIAEYLDLTTSQANAAINAGRVLMALPESEFKAA